EGDAVRGADLIVAAVAAADRAGVVEVDVPAVAQGGGDVPGLGRQVGVAGQRQHRSLDRGEPVVEPGHGPLLRLAAGGGRLGLGVGGPEGPPAGPVHAAGGLDHVRDEALAGFGVEVGHVLAGGPRVRGQVEVGAVGDALELAPLAARELVAVLDVHGALGVVR